MPTNRLYSKVTDIPNLIPLFPISGVVLLPHGELPLNIFELRYLALVDAALATNRLIGIIQPNLSTDEDHPYERIGCVGRITSFQETGDGRYWLGLTGLARFYVHGVIHTEAPFLSARVDYTPFAGDLYDIAPEMHYDTEPLFTSLQSFFEVQQLDADWRALRSAPVETLISAMVTVLPITSIEKQALLEADSTAKRAELVIALTERLVARTHGGKYNGLQ